MQFKKYLNLDEVDKGFECHVPVNVLQVAILLTDKQGDVT